MKIKNTHKGKIIGEKVVDINKIYHYIHGKSKYTDRIVNIKHSPTVKYLLGDTKEYTSGSKDFNPRPKSFPYLLDLFDKGNWFDVLVYEHEGKFIVLDGMHRSSILFYKGYEEIKVKLIEKFPFRNNNFSDIIQKI
jgi:hypothetical protein